MKTWALILDVFRQSRASVMFWVVFGISTLTGLGLLVLGVEGNDLVLLWSKHISLDLPVALVVKVILNAVDLIVIGWIGLGLMVIATGDFWPGFLNRGWVLLKLSKPISRVQIFVGRTIGACLFVAFHAAYFAVLTFVVVGVRTGFWIWGHLLLVPILVAGFLIIYSMSTLIGIRYRSTVFAILGAIGFWFICWAANAALVTVRTPMPIYEQQATTYRSTSTAEDEQPDEMVVYRSNGNRPVRYERLVEDDSAIYKAMYAAYLVLPKIEDLDVLFTQAMFDLPPAQEMEPGDPTTDAMNQQPETDWPVSIGTTLVAILLIYGLALWRFVRTDY